MSCRGPSSFSSVSPPRTESDPPACRSPPDPPSGSSAVVIGRLTPGTLYHYRAADRNPDGTGFGADATFNTPAAPKLSKLTVHGRRVSYRDTEPGLAKFSVFAGHTKIARFSHRGIAGHNRFKFKKHLQPGAYVLKAIAYNSFGSPSKRVIKHFQVKG